MSLDTKTAKLAGNPDSSGCSQAYDIQPENPAKLDTHGELHLSVSIKDISDNSQSVFVIRGIVAQIQKKYYDSSGNNVLIALSDAISSTLETYQKEIEIASVVILKGNAYIVVYGTAEVLLKRDSKIAVFKSPNGAVFKSRGKLQSGDVLVLATRDFVRETADTYLNNAFDKQDPSKMIEYLAPIVQSIEARGTLCAMFIKFTDQPSVEELRPVDMYPKINAPNMAAQTALPQVQKNLATDEKKGPKPKTSFLDKFKRKRFYVQDFHDEKDNKRRRMLSFAGMALMMVLAGTVSYGLYQKREKERVEKIESVVATIEKDLQEAEEVFSYSPQRSQELVERSREELKKLEDPALKAQDRLASVSQRIDSAQGSVLGMHMAEANDFLDLNLLSSGFSGDKLTVYNDHLYVLDTKNERLVSVVIPSKRSEVVAGPDVLSGVVDVAVWSRLVFILKPDGLYDVNGSEVLAERWSDKTLIKSYSGGVYFLDKQNSEIIRYSISDGRLTSRTIWLSNEVSADFSKIASWSIDGAIWLSSESGAVFKYVYGYQRSFELGKVAPELTSGAVVYANSDNEYLYLLDKKNSRILVFDKDGVYKEQYNEEVIKDALDLAVFEREKKIILLTGDRLKYIEIN